MKKLKQIYVDHAATAPMHPQVIRKMVEVMENEFGNPSSIHAFGRKARHIIDEARFVLAKSIHANINEIIITSGGTEADNLAIIGYVEANQHKGKHIITTEIEHHAVLRTCEALEKKGFEVTYLPVNEEGQVSVQSVENALRDDTILVTIMYGNNEVGTIQPIGEISELLKDHQAVLHTDAVQAFGLVDIDVKKLGIDLLSVSSHKINGPKGIGFLYVNQNIHLSPLLNGGEQERKRRAGTENVPAIASFAEAIKIMEAEREEKWKTYKHFKNMLMEIFQEEGIEFLINGSMTYSLPHIFNVSFPKTDVEAMLVNLDLEGIAASSGSACTAGSIDPSHVLVAMFGKDSERIRNSIRFSFGLNNTEAEIEVVGRKTAEIVKRLIK